MFIYSLNQANTPTRKGLDIDCQTSPISLASSSSEKRPSSSRSLHDKLSSPDRKKISQLTSEEVLQLYNARQSAAESNRDQTLAERRMKAAISSSRAKIIEEREAKRIAQAEETYSSRQRSAKKRHEDYIQSIRGKAGNENAKVSEVIFINTLNAACLNEQLQQQLSEVEERIRAGRQRRQNRLNTISTLNKYSNSKKGTNFATPLPIPQTHSRHVIPFYYILAYTYIVQQMSSLRLSLETQRMERWDKLQLRIESVQTRRDARLRELARRKESLLPENKENNESSATQTQDDHENIVVPTANYHVAGVDCAGELKKKKRKKTNKSTRTKNGILAFPVLPGSPDRGQILSGGNLRIHKYTTNKYTGIQIKV